MSGRNVSVVLIPRYTSYVGGANYPSLSIPVSAYESLTINCWRNTGFGVLPVVNLNWIESNDLLTWTACTVVSGSATIVANVEQQSIVKLSKAWFRFVIGVPVANGGVTMWAEGFFQLRER